MFLRVSQIKVWGFWEQPEIGLHGYIGCILEDGTPVGLCSKEKWLLGKEDSLRKDWNNNYKIFDEPHTVYSDFNEKVLRQQGLFKSSKEMAMTPPQELLDKVFEKLSSN